ncbi:MAG: hypothetical protein MZW92_56015 [Comamonadaceae bacterium]|nr:hypothetical protein [Comamonadaceae bacterium]
MLPLTHFLRIVRGDHAQGRGAGRRAAADAGRSPPSSLVAGAIAMKRYRQTID